MNRVTKVRRSADGFVEYCPDDVFTFEMHYDMAGRYVGQRQTNVLDDGPDFFFKADIVNGRPHVDGVEIPDLSAERMAGAEG